MRICIGHTIHCTNNILLAKRQHSVGLRRAQRQPSAPIHSFGHFNIQTLEHQPLCFFTRTAPDLFYLPAFWGVAIGSGKRNIYMGESIVSKADWRLYYNVGDTIDIKIATIDNLSYNIFYGYARNLSFSRNFLFPYNYNSPSNLSSSLGYWCGLNACEERVTISY